MIPVVLAAALIVLDGPPKPCAAPAEGARVQVDLVDAPVAEVARIVACYRGLNLTISKPPAGTVTIYGPTPVSPAEVVLALTGALDDRGWMLARRGRFLALVPSKSAPAQPGASPRMTLLLRPEHVTVAEVQPVLASLASDEASIIAHAPTNLLVVTERADNVRRLRRLLGHLDLPETRPDLRLYAVRHAQVATLAEHVRALLDGKVRKVVVDARTERMVVVAPPAVHREVARLLAMLDVPRGDGAVHTLRPLHGKATDLAKLVESMRAKDTRR